MDYSLQASWERFSGLAPPEGPGADPGDTGGIYISLQVWKCLSVTCGIAGESGWGEGGLGNSVEVANTTTQTREDNGQMDAWMTVQYMDLKKDGISESVFITFSI